MQANKGPGPDPTGKAPAHQPWCDPERVAKFPDVHNHTFLQAIVYLLHAEKRGEGSLTPYQARQVIDVLKMLRKGPGNRGFQETTVMTLLMERQKKELCRMFSSEKNLQSPRGLI